MAAQQFNLRWNNHTNNLLQVFTDQFEKEQMVDVTLTCQGQFIKAHKMILGACSPYFQEIFDRHGSTPHPVIIMNGLKIDDIRSIVEFMYRGEVKVCESDLESLLATAENLQIKGLSNVRATRQGQGQTSSPMNTNFSNNNSSNQSCQSSEGSGNRNSSTTSNSFGNGSNANHSTSGRSNSSSHSNDKGSTDTSESVGTPLHLKRTRSRKVNDNKNDNNITDAHSPKNENSSTSKSSVLQDAEDSNDLPMTIRIDPPYIRDIDEDEEVEWDVKDNASIAEPCDGQDGKVNQNQNSRMNSETGMSAAHAGYLTEPKEKIPRPPNSFMIFANEWRRKLATQFPNESNKEISVRLGIMWKNLSGDSKEEYFAASRQANEEHKRKYPDYYYSPKEARMRKRWKMQQQQVSNLMSSGQYNPVHLVKVFIDEDGEGDRQGNQGKQSGTLHRQQASTH